MDGVYEMAASPLPVEIDGKTYLLSPITAQDEGEIELAILRERKRPSDVLAEMLPKLDPQAQKTLLEIAWTDEVRGPRVRYRDVMEWLQTKRGSLYRLWLMFRKHQPELTLADVEALAAKADLDKQADEMSGKSLGNFSAPVQAGANPPTASLGDLFSADSALSTDSSLTPSAA